MITVEQRPLTMTPVNTEHVYSVISPNRGNENYRYVFDVYVDTRTASPEKVARLLVSPNTYGKGIINVEDIVFNYVKGNARSEQPQYTSSATTGTTSYGLLSNTKGLSPSNAFNNNTDYNTEHHVRDYRVMVGEQWTSAGATVTYISTDADTPGSTFYAQVEGGTFREIGWYGAGANIVSGSTLLPGVAWNWTDSGAGLKDSGIDINPDGSVPFTADTIDVGDIVTITERYSGIIYTFTAFDAYGSYETVHWELTEIEYPESSYDPVLTPPAVLIWPGTTLKAGSYNPYVFNAPYWDTTSPTEQQDYWEVKKYRMSGTTVTEQEPSLFLTSGGDSDYNVDDTTYGITTCRARRRKHHPSCPVIVSFFNGPLSYNTDFEFVNDIGCFTEVTGTDKYGDYTALTEHPITKVTTGLTPTDNTIMYYTTIRPDLAGGKLGYWTAGDVGDYQYDGYAYSEFLEFYLQDNSCLSDPVHLLFMNRQGVWDTYTFDVKALEQSNIKKDTYAQGGIKNTNVYSQLSTNRRQTIYDTTITQAVNVSSWYLDDDDKQIVEDLFMSPEIYIIKDHDWTGKTEKSYNPYLLPVILRTDSITEFKNRYNKLAQYNFTFEYTPINQYKTQG